MNRALYKCAFKMTTLKQILAQNRPGDWFISVDLKDAYFHIQIAPRHRRFLRFAFKGTAYQFTVMPFGLALAPRTFTKCVDAALSHLRASGIRILNYFGGCAQQPQTRSITSPREPRSLCEQTKKRVTPQPVNHVSGGAVGLNLGETASESGTHMRFRVFSYL